MTLNEALQQVTISVPDAGRLFFDLGRNASYEAAKAGEIPTIKIGGLLRVPVAKICNMLGIERGLIPTHQEKGPAGAATPPSHGSKRLTGHLNMKSNTTAAAARQEAISEARDNLTRIKDLNDLMFTAGEGLLTISRTKANAICAGADVIADLLNEVCDLIDGERS